MDGFRFPLPLGAGKSSVSSNSAFVSWPWWLGGVEPSIGGNAFITWPWWSGGVEPVEPQEPSARGTGKPQFICRLGGMRTW